MMLLEILRFKRIFIMFVPLVSNILL